jgi:hypothetical protein
MIEVFNLHEDKWEGRGTYVGRPSALGNPFVVGRDGSRAEVIEKFRQWLWEIVRAGRAGRYAGLPPVTEEYVRTCQVRKLVDDDGYRQAVWEAVEDLRPRAARAETLNLLCYCKPLPCHADVIRSCLEWLVQTPAPAS